MPGIDDTVTRGRERKRVCSNDVWVNPQTVWEVPDKPGWRLVRLIHPTDLQTWATAMRHCGAFHVRRVCEDQTWHFLTIIDDKGVPHVTIHGKDEALCQQEWEDGRQGGFGFRPPKYDSEGKAAEWGEFRMYGNRPTAAFPHPVRVGEHVFRIVSCSNPGTGDAGKYTEIIQQWYEASKVEEEALATA